LIRVDPRNHWQNSISKKMRHRPATDAALLVKLFQLVIQSPVAAGRWHWSDSTHKERRFYQNELRNCDSKNRAP
jgi:hypothetical protein